MNESNDFFEPQDDIGKDLREKAAEAARVINEHPSMVERHGNSDENDKFYEELVTLWNNEETRKTAEAQIEFIKKRLKNVGTGGDGHLMQRIAWLQGQGVEIELNDIPSKKG